MKELRILEKLATGGMATVYLGEWKGRKVVVKKLHAHLSSDRNFVERFRREAEILKDLKHKNIITFLDFIEDGEDYLLVLEYIEGVSLKHLIEQGKIPPAITVQVALQISEGMAFAHSKGIIHRDLKPGNVLISKEGIVKISDFGLALRESTRVTDPGVYIGTPAYMAPEVVGGCDYSIKSDIFSFGVLLYEMLTGRNPFEGKTPFETINNLLYSYPPPLSKQGIPRSLSNLVMTMISKSPDKRPENFEKIHRELKKLNTASWKELVKFLHGEEVHLPIKELKGRNRKRSLILSLIVVMLLLVVSVTIKIYHKKTPVVTEIKKDETIVPEKTEPIHEETLSTSRAEKTEIKPTRPEVKKPYKNTATIPPGRGFISIKVKPWGKVFIDGKFVDETPISTPLMLSSGKHTIKVEHPTLGTVEREIIIMPNDTTSLSFDLSPGFIKIKVRPWGYVYVDGEKIGMTPLPPIKVKPGKHRITVINPDYNEWSKTVEINRGDTLKVEAMLK